MQLLPPRASSVHVSSSRWFHRYLLFSEEEEETAKKRKPGQKKELSTEARKAFAMAERVETRAYALEQSLKKEGAEDKILPLSVFAPRRRLMLHTSFKQAGLGGGRQSVFAKEPSTKDSEDTAEET